ncbi:Aspartate aminotransferase [Paraburkholderia caribensis MBA4]|uniref:Aminotransferase n=1 Tax=Paraburkholderia caribensis MBA4 TaxID=1323664 RepID=A0A0P0RIH4_9BURK|nr:pyridoxal phosphate-dependent aminotransferase [Paraburkholderia caribensis]ALL68418.1 Aspartate aminotransferase [Paraburkholderia caribensis MBA4]
MTTEFKHSDALSRISPSATIAITQKARDMRASGRNNILSLSIGEPDFDTPEHVCEAARAAIAAGSTRYPPVSGVPVLKEAVSAKFTRDNGLRYAINQVLVSAGAKQVIANALMATLNSGDEVLIPTPYWVSYPQLTQLCGARPVFLATKASDGFLLQADILEAAITPRTRWLILNSPSNPSGAVMDRQALARLGEVLQRHPHVWILTDDIYEHLIYTDTPYSTIAQVCPDLFDRTLTVNGVSKAYAMTGWRIGFAGGPAPLIKAMELVQSQLSGGASSIAQWAAAAALNGPQDFIHECRTSFRIRRDRLVAALREIKHMDCEMPEGAFYAFPSCEAFLGCATSQGKVLKTDEDFVSELLDKTGVAAVHGSAFGSPGYFRISYAASSDVLDEACGRISDFCCTLR